MRTSRRKGGQNVGQNQILEYLCFKVLAEIVITINLEGSGPESGLSDNEANKRKRREEKGLLLLLEKTSLCFLSPPPTSILKIVTLWSN